MAEYYLAPYTPRKCASAVCHSLASQELRNQRNATVNWYCSKHGPKALSSLLEEKVTNVDAG